MLHSSNEICEALIRHTEMVGEEVFEKHFTKDGEILCTVWCVLGPNAEKFTLAMRKWLDDNGFHSSPS